MSKDIIKFNEILESYVYLKECCAINNERAELDLDLDIYDLEDYKEVFQKIDSELKYNDWITIKLY